MMRILVVDDSIVFRSQISACLKGVPGVEVVGTASNGKIALQKLEQESIDLMTLDMEMPELDGLGTLAEIQKKGLKVKVIVFSSQTPRGAEKALEALKWGAHDVVTKPRSDALNFEAASQGIQSALVPKVLQFLAPDSSRASVRFHSLDSRPQITLSVPRKDVELFSPEVIVIASSTGGPNALEEIFKNFKNTQPRIPVLIVQHMPPVFTQILAKRLSEVSGLLVKEAVDGEHLEKGMIRIAPGDFHMRLEKTSDEIQIQLHKGPMRNSVRPAADELFESAAEIFSFKTLGVVLTGMGEDAFVGGRRIRELGGAVVIQNKESCVVFGMPGILFQENQYDAMGDLNFLAQLIKSKF